MEKTPEGKLYSPALLSLATELASYPLSDELDLRASGRSRTCGSSIEIGIRLSSDGKVSHIGMRVAACAVGQASAALLAKSASGKSVDEIVTAYRTIDNWLSGQGELPDWPLLKALLSPSDSTASTPTEGSSSSSTTESKTLPVNNQVYQWVDEDGRTHFSDEKPR